MSEGFVTGFSREAYLFSAGSNAGSVGNIHRKYCFWLETFGTRSQRRVTLSCLSAFCSTHSVTEMLLQNRRLLAFFDIYQ